jgi:hypothetical protein
MGVCRLHLRQSVQHWFIQYYLDALIKDDRRCHAEAECIMHLD